MENPGYNDLMENLFISVTDAPGMDMCGEKSSTALQAVSERTDSDTYFDLEEQITCGFRENAYNGFCSGFRCAALLLLGKQPFPE